MPTVLIVEDAPDARAVAAFFLEDAGYRVTEASSADRALFLLDAHQDIDLVFSDIQMSGGMNGIALAQ